MAYYFAVFLPVQEGGYSVEFPDFPEIASGGKDIEECMRMGDEALTMTIEEYAKERRAIPVPSTLEAVKTWIGNVDSTYLDTGREPFIQIYRAPTLDLTPVRVNISLAKYILEMADAKAQQCGMTRSGLLARAVMAYQPS